MNSAMSVAPRICHRGFILAAGLVELRSMRNRYATAFERARDTKNWPRVHKSPAQFLHS